jgi:hypothetical protein
MCHFITAALAPGAKIDEVAKLAKLYGLAWVSIANKSVLAKLEKGSTYFYTATGMCDCGTEIGSNNLYPSKQKTDFSSEITRFKNKGWTENKIKNWLAAKQKNVKKTNRVKANSGAGAELEKWRKFIADLLNAKHSKQVTLLVHMYHRGLESERIAIECLTKTKLYDLSDSVLINIKEDHLYQFNM